MMLRDEVDKIFYKNNSNIDIQVIQLITENLVGFISFVED